MDLSELERLDHPQVGRLKLSEAIRIGSSRYPPCYGIWSSGNAACAITAAAWATGMQATTPYSFTLRRHFESIGLHIGEDVWREVVHVRNSRGDSHKSIADWLASRGL